MPTNASLTQHPMRTICDAWLAKIKLALKVREEKFGKYAEEASRFYDGPHDFMWQEGYSRGPGGFLDKDAGVLPTFRVTINNVFKAVALFGPALYHQNPNVLVSPILPAEVGPEALGIDPNDPYGMLVYQQLAQEEQLEYKTRQACASVKSRYLNWVQRENDKKTHARRAISEAIITGLGYLETSVYQPPGSQRRFPRSTYISWYDVVVDPDAAYWEDVQWIAIRRTKPVNLTERRFGLERGELKGQLQSLNAQASPKARNEAKDGRQGKSFDLIEYWEVFSKNGFGDLLFDDTQNGRVNAYDYSVLGDNCWLSVSENIPYPLNCPTSLLLEGDVEQVLSAVQWPVAYHMDVNGWPVSRLTFYEKANQVWPIGLFKPATGEMRFVNWCMSFLADKVAASCHTYVAYMKAAGATIQKQLNGSNTPFTVIELQEALGFKNINEVVSFLQAPNFPADIWKMLAEVTQEIDEKTGVTELLQGLTSRSMRSAAEANIKNERVSVRPDDMAARTEDFLSEVAVREMQAAAYGCGVDDVAPAVGRMGAIVWQNYVANGDPEHIVRDYDYTVEAGSTRKPNKQTKVQQLTEMGQVVVPVIQAFVAAGNVAPYNAYITELAKANDLDPAPFQVEPPPPGPPPEAQAEMDAKQQEMQLKLAEMQAHLGMEQQSNSQELQHAEQMHKLEMSQKRDELAMKKQESKAKVQATKAKPKGPKK